MLDLVTTVLEVLGLVLIIVLIIAGVGVTLSGLSQAGARLLAMDGRRKR